MSGRHAAGRHAAPSPARRDRRDRQAERRPERRPQRRHARPASSHSTAVRVVGGFVASAVALLLVPGMATATWRSQLAGDASAAAAATTVGAGKKPTTAVSGGAVTLSWAASTLASGGAVDGYRIQRLDAGTLAASTISTDCSATAHTTCVDAPPLGSWVYTVTPTIGTHWKGATSPASATVTLTSQAPVGGSVDATGLGGTTGRYATSTALSLALNPGTDSDGIAAGATLTRAYAALTSSGNAAGECGTFSAFTSVATDPGPTYADTVPAAGRCYRYRYTVSDTLGNTSVWQSPDILVDTTAPSTPTLTPAAQSASAFYPGTGSTVYYRPTTTGSFSLTAATADDAESGVASLVFPSLGAGWTSSISGTTATYSWTASPASPGTRSVTATNHAGLSSAGRSFTPTPDGTAPTGVSLTYANTTTTASHLSVSLTTGSDAGSGLAVKLLQRAAAPLSGTTCGAYGAFATVVNGEDPMSTVVDRLTRGFCYKYQLVVRDNVGNETVVSSTNVVKAAESAYSGVVKSTPGLTHYWRLGEATTLFDTFTGTAGTLVYTRNPDLGASWVRASVGSGSEAAITAAGRTRRTGSTNATNGTIYLASMLQDSSDYTVEADLYIASSLANDSVGVVGRADMKTVTTYAAGYDQATSTWRIDRVVNYSRVNLAATAPTPVTVGRTYHIALDMRGSRLRLLVDGVELLAVTDALVGTGQGGFAMGYGPGTSVPQTDTTGMHLDNVRITPAMRDDVGSDLGFYLGAPTGGSAGPVTSDLDTAVTLDGANDTASATTTVGDDASVELWFRSSAGLGTGATWQSGSPLVFLDTATTDDLGISLRSDGRVVAGLGATSIVSTSAGYANNAWHHVVLTRRRSDGALALYLDGAAAGTATGTTAATAGAATLRLGRGAAAAPPWFSGRLDEVALYNVALSGTTVAAHAAATS